MKTYADTCIHTHLLEVPKDGRTHEFIAEICIDPNQGDALITWRLWMCDLGGANEPPGLWECAHGTGCTTIRGAIDAATAAAIDQVG